MEFCKEHRECRDLIVDTKARQKAYDEKLEGHVEWMNHMEETIRKNHAEVLRAISALQAEINQAKGAVWMFLKIAGGIGVVSALIIALLKIQGV